MLCNAIDKITVRFIFGKRNMADDGLGLLFFLALVCMVIMGIDSCSNHPPIITTSYTTMPNGDVIKTVTEKPFRYQGYRRRY